MDNYGHARPAVMHSRRLSPVVLCSSVPAIPESPSRNRSFAPDACAVPGPVQPTVRCLDRQIAQDAEYAPGPDSVYDVRAYDWQRYYRTLFPQAAYGVQFLCSWRSTPPDDLRSPHPGADGRSGTERCNSNLMRRHDNSCSLSVSATPGRNRAPPGGRSWQVDPVPQTDCDVTLPSSERGCGSVDPEGGRSPH